MERTEVLDMMSSLKLYGMRNAYDETLVTALNGHDILRIDARGGHRAVEPRHDARDLALRGGRAAGDDRLAAFRCEGAA